MSSKLPKKLRQVGGKISTPPDFEKLSDTAAGRIEELEKQAKSQPALLAACEWLQETMNRDSLIWCAIREHDGCSEWIKGLKAAIKAATEEK